MRHVVLVCMALTLVSSGPIKSVQAQQRRPPAATQPTPAPVPEPPAEAVPPTYEPELLRLAEVLGGLSYLTKLCDVKDSDSWQIRMDQLMEAEGPTKTRKERLAGAYNRGYLGYQPAHRVCSVGSRNAIDRLIEQGQKITSDLSRRYGG
jgi:uncharacterized protein (TIGR02301 family)